MIFRSTLLVASFALFLTITASAQTDLSNYGVRVEPDKRVMIVLAALDAARTTNENGVEVQVINTRLSPEGEKFRDLLRSDLAAMPADLRQRISSFLIAHKKRYSSLSDAELVAPFISMAYALTPAPELADPIVTSDLPGNLLDVLDFAPLVRDFYRRSSFSGNVNDYIKTYQKTADSRLRGSAGDMVSELLRYLNTRPRVFIEEKVKTETQKGKSKRTTLKNVESRTRERRFIISPELLAPLGYVSFVNVRDDYHVVLPAELPSNRDLLFSDVRRGFLQFVVDPLVTGNGKDIETIRPGVKALLDDRRRIDPTASPDVFLTISRSLVAAIDANQSEKLRIDLATEQARQKIEKAKTDEDKRTIARALAAQKVNFSDESALQMSEDFEKGAILVFYFSEQLKGIEDSGFDIATSIREMLLSLDPAKETGRLAQFADARKRALAAREERRKNPSANAVVENPVVSKLSDIQAIIAQKNYNLASSQLKELARNHPTDARILYNLGRVASLAAESVPEDDVEGQRAKLLEAKSAYESIVNIHRKQLSDASRGTQVVETVDRALLSLTFVALAKIYEFYDNSTYAIGIYDEAIKLGRVTGGAFDEAIAAKARLLKEKQ